MGALTSSFLRFLEHTQRRTTVGRTLLDEWYSHRRDVYLTTQNNPTDRHSFLRRASKPHSQQTSGWKPRPLTARPLETAHKNISTGNVNVKRHNAFCPHIALKYFIRFQHEPAMIFVNIINGLIFATELCVSCGTGIYFCARSQVSRGYIYIYIYIYIYDSSFTSRHEIF